jgi:hypothetical protein
VPQPIHLRLEIREPLLEIGDAEAHARTEAHDSKDDVPVPVSRGPTA